MDESKMDEEKKTIPIELKKILLNVKGKPFTNLRRDDYGNPVLVKVREDKVAVYEKDPVNMKHVIVTALTSETPEEQKGKKLSGRMKLKMDMLARKVEACEDEFYEFTVSQVSVICKRVDAVYNQKSIVSHVWQDFNYNIPENLEFEE